VTKRANYRNQCARWCCIAVSPIRLLPLVSLAENIPDAANCSTVITAESATITVYPRFTITPDTTICRNSPAPLHVSGGQAYAWSPAANLNNPNISNPVAQISQSTRFFVAGKDLNNCDILDSVMVNILTEPVFQAPSDQSVCKGGSVVLNNGNDPTKVYAWTPVSFERPASPAPMRRLIKLLSITWSFQIRLSPIDSFRCPGNSQRNTHYIASKTNDIDCSNLTSHLGANGAVSITGGRRRTK
jgi:hypothetical protein